IVQPILLLKTIATALVLVAAAAVAFGWLAWKCVRDPKIDFLPQDARAEWILFPAPVGARTHRVATMDATFRRTFTLQSQLSSAQLLVRAAKRLELKINGERVPIPASRNWKEISTMVVSNFLRTGENTIEARVFNDDAPPALWLSLKADSTILRSDGSWEASLAGSAWRNCALASIPRQPGAGNLLSGGEKITDALRRILRAWIVFALIALLITIGTARWFKTRGDDINLSRGEVFTLLGICALAWLILFWNNAKMLPFHCGYDFKDHLAYIKYIQERGALPLPNQGYEMFQPPLLYAIAAALLSILHLSTADAGAVPALRALTMLFGIANFVFAFLSLRLLFPGRAAAQFVGLITAAFLPMQLYLSHYVTNEVFAALLATVSIYLGLRAFMVESESSWRLLGLGACVGAAMLAKSTSLLLLPPVIG